MPWKVSNVENERLKFVAEWQSGDWTMAELCYEFGVSRQTGYKWLGRYNTEGLDGLKDRSSAPKYSPQAVSEEIEKQILRVRAKHSHWGPTKIQAWLIEHHPEQRWPAASTIGEILKRAGVSRSRRRVRQPGDPGPERCDYGEANSLWCADFKGWFRTGDGSRCEPFTLMDGSTRYLLRCQALARTDHEMVQAILTAAFQEYGLPDAMRSDNGTPFAASRGFAGLSRLGVWLVRLGVRPDRIDKGKPQQNGRLERLHRTLKAECATPSAMNLRSQQKRFDQWRSEYNEERPHQALGQRVPASCYEASARRMPVRLPLPEYPDYVRVRQVNSKGSFRWRGGLLDVGSVLARELVGMAELGDDEGRYWRLFLGPLPLAIYDEWYGVWIPKMEAEGLVRQWPNEDPWHW